ncbi:MAG TPA: septum formation family protein [Marmoricola sp.]|nr:septum formation family protein [Marmoricola sp.]
MPQLRWIALALAAATLLAGCGNNPSDTKTPPENGLCRVLTIADLSQRTNGSDPVDCTSPHTAQTILVTAFPASVGANYQAEAVGAYAYKTCSPAFETYLGATDSSVMRVQMSWAWFGPTQSAWDRGARWFRCDVVGAPSNQSSITDIPTNLKNLLAGFPPDQWLTCATGDAFATRIDVSCAQPHTWRAVTAVKLGQPNDPYPGDHISQIRANNYCSDAIGVYFNYTNTYEYGYTVFHAAEWKAGNRRAVCWAKTSK